MYSKLCKLMGVALLLGFGSVATASSSYWTINFQDSVPTGIFEHLQNMFNYFPVNPDASCLKPSFSFESDRQWSDRDAEKLIQKVMLAAGCSVSFNGVQYKLGEIGE